MECEYNAHIWIMFTSAIGFLVGAAVNVGYMHLQNSVFELVIKKQTDEMNRLSSRIEEIHTQYETDMLTLLRETLSPSTLSEECKYVEPVLDNNSIPVGPSGPK